ncbi:c-type cytochrome [Humitalea sp. 24SJ18S-53]|uniref:c-type cytochrome n=1 Tax=Humitalea sp. 24SJ18S-53 TaxID=3422307 RepID=UPI003D67104D
MMMRSALLLAVALVATAPPARAADPARGEEKFAQDCVACHTMTGEHGLGPGLRGVIGRRAGSLEDFRYSPAMRRSAVVWSPATLEAFLAEPQGVVRGNRMPFGGVENATDRADIVAYLARGSPP